MHFLDIPLDPLRQPYEIGQSVLTNGYYHSGMTTVVKVEKINRKTVAVTIPAWKWEDHPYVNAMGERTVRRVKVACEKRMLKPFNKAVIVDQQLEYNKLHFPEYMV